MDELIDQMFRPESFGRQGGHQWNEELFRRAYVEFDGPFRRICGRLRIGYSVLAYVPGNCMSPAAAIVKADLDRNFSWNEYLEHPEGDKTLEDVFRTTTSLPQAIRKWFTNGEGTAPAAIFHNLDFLCDGRGGMSAVPFALTALAGLVSGSRQGVVLGMSDRDEPPVANAVSRAFTEQIRIDEIPYKNFRRLIPVALGEKLRRWDSLTDGAISVSYTHLTLPTILRV